MKQFKFNRPLTGIIACLIVLVGIQWYWLIKLIHWQRIEFNKSINLSLEKTLADERKQRTDSISNAICNWMMDSSLTTITSKINPVYKTMVYYIGDKAGSAKKQSSFSLSYENRPVTTQNDTVKKAVVQSIVSKFRQSYSDYQAVFFLHTSHWRQRIIAVRNYAAGYRKNKANTYQQPAGAKHTNRFSAALCYLFRFSSRK